MKPLQVSYMPRPGVRPSQTTSMSLPTQADTGINISTLMNLMIPMMIVVMMMKMMMGAMGSVSKPAEAG